MKTERVVIMKEFRNIITI